MSRTESEEICEGPVPSSVPPCMGAGRCLTAGLAKAREELQAALSPGFSGKGGWIRGVRIAGRRLRILLLPLMRPGDPEGIRAIRSGLKEILDDLSASRDLQVVRKWLARKDVDWKEDEEVLGKLLLGEESEPEGSGGDLQGNASKLLQPHLDQIRDLIRSFLPEELRAPIPTGFPGVWIGASRQDCLLPWKKLRHRSPGAPERFQVHDFMTHLLASPLVRMKRILDDSLHPEDLHDIRRDLRKFRYLVEALVGSFPELASLEEPMKHFVWLLGQINDRRLIEELLEARPRDPSESRGRDDMTQRLEAEIQKILDESREMTQGPLQREKLAAVLDIILGERP